MVFLLAVTVMLRRLVSSFLLPLLLLLLLLFPLLLSLCSLLLLLLPNLNRLRQIAVQIFLVHGHLLFTSLQPDHDLMRVHVRDFPDHSPVSSSNDSNLSSHSKRTQSFCCLLANAFFLNFSIVFFLSWLWDVSATSSVPLWALFLGNCSKSQTFRLRTNLHGLDDALATSSQGLSILPSHATHEGHAELRDGHALVVVQLDFLSTLCQIFLQRRIFAEHATRAISSRNGQAKGHVFIRVLLLHVDCFLE
mmetsp:Transcript_321/g.673  ORF Transcript_321/g.673 Transcript_321/m.673 type:complete len:249 (-) Transcript_321:303-1049(-)